MSIGFHKIEEMISKTVADIDGLNDEQRRMLSDLCKRVYTVESSALAAGKSSRAVIEELRSDIANVSDQIFS